MAGGVTDWCVSWVKAMKRDEEKNPLVAFVNKRSKESRDNERDCYLWHYLAAPALYPAAGLYSPLFTWSIVIEDNGFVAPDGQLELAVYKLLPIPDPVTDRH